MDPIVLMLMIWFGLGMGSAKLLQWMVGERKDDDEKPLQLPAKQTPALSKPRDGPYRESGKDKVDNRQNSDEDIDSEERFRRFVYASTRLKGRVNELQLQELANALDLELLLSTLEDSEADSVQTLAAIIALSIRTDPTDIDELLDLLFTTEWHRAVHGVLLALRSRGPVNDEVISAIWDIVYDIEENSDNQHSHRLAEDILAEWEEKYPDVIAKFILLQ